jgi:hypothetical protein
MAPNEVHPDFLAEVMQVLRKSWRALKKIIQDAREINLPAMKNFEEGENLASFILPEKMVPEPPLSYVKGNWCQKLVDQLGSVRSKCFRLHFKSVGGILALQERIAAAWKESRAPVPAEIVEPDSLLAAEAIPAEVVVEGFVDELPAQEVVLAAEVVPAEVAVESFVEALPIDDVAEPPPLISPISAAPAAAPMAAFLAASPPPAAAGPSFTPVAPVDAPPVVAPPIAAASDEPPPLPIQPVMEPTPAMPHPTVEPPQAAFAFDAPTVVSKGPPRSADVPVFFNLDEAKPAPAAQDDGVFSLDADEIAAAHAPERPPAEEVFSLDAGSAAPAVNTFSLDADADIIDVEPLDDEPVVAEVLEEPSIGSGSVPAPDARPAPATGSSASMPALGEVTGAGKNGVRKRPPVKITLVRPGEKSPFA